MKIEGDAYRENGQWKIVLDLPPWLIDDIFLDATRQERVIVALSVEGRVSVSYYGTPPKRVVAFSPVLFEEVDDKK